MPSLQPSAAWPFCSLSSSSAVGLRLVRVVEGEGEEVVGAGELQMPTGWMEANRLLDAEFLPSQVIAAKEEENTMIS